MKTQLNRITRLEKAIQEILNPEEDKLITLVVYEIYGQSVEQRIWELEKELGRKISPKKILLVVVSKYRRKSTIV